MVGTSLSKEGMIKFIINKEDVIESFIRSSGPGGQNVNKVATCVALLHKPTGIMIKCRKFRTQLLNRQQAWEMLHQALQERQDQERLFRQAKREKIRRQNRKRSLPAKERMLENKKKNTLKKQSRKKPLNWE
jgi:peptide chain release factor